MADEPIGERIATLREKVETHQREIQSLRETRHEHADKLQELDLRVRETEKEVAAMTTEVVPAIRKSLSVQAEQIRKTALTVTKTKLDYGWVTRILAVALGIANSIGIAVIVWLVTGNKH